MADDEKPAKKPTTLDKVSAAATVASKAIMDIKRPTFDSTDHTPSMHSGGVVPKDGIYNLQGGERVIPKDKPVAKKISMYRAMHQLRKGGLHKEVGVPHDQAIPADKLEAARNSDNSHVAQMANFQHQKNELNK